MSGPSVSTIKKLCAVSNNICAFPCCENKLITNDKFIGKICHIKAKSIGGKRYDPKQTEEERNGFENLILMCPIHHDVIDNDDISYTVERLLEIKKEHESFSAKPFNVNDSTASIILSTDDSSEQNIINSNLVADNITISSKNNSKNIVENSDIKATKSHLHASDNSKNYFDRTNFKGQIGSVRMSGISTYGDIIVENSGIGLGPNSGIIFGGNPNLITGNCPFCNFFY
ncbi:MAG: hypothetical protein WCI41_03905 [bacterium]